MWQLVPIDATTPNMKSKEKSEKEKQEGGGQREKKQTPTPKQDKQGKQQPVTTDQFHHMYLAAAHSPPLS
jgi:hypothetical protein